MSRAPPSNRSASSTSTIIMSRWGRITCSRVWSDALANLGIELDTSDACEVTIMTERAFDTSPTRSEPAAPDFVVLGNPGCDRVAAFQSALAGLGLPPARLVAYLEIIAGRTSMADVLRPGSVLRIESPGGDFEVELALVAEGADVEDEDDDDASPRPARIGRDDALRQPFDRGLIFHPRQWYLGFRKILRRLDRQRQDCPPHAVMNPPAAIEILFDKPRCHRVLTGHGVPCPCAIGPVRSYDELRTRMSDEGRCGSSSSWRTARRPRASWPWRLRPGEVADTTVEMVRLPGGLRLYNSRRIRRYQGPGEIAELIDALCRERVHVEQWIPKAGLDGMAFDLRVVVIAGRARHIVPRLSSSPMTNLHLKNRRGDVEALRREWARAPGVRARDLPAGRRVLLGLPLRGRGPADRPGLPPARGPRDQRLRRPVAGHHLPRPGYLHGRGRGVARDRSGERLVIDVPALIGTHDVLLMTIDTLRYDVARGRVANGTDAQPGGRPAGRVWEERHSPGSFTYAAHHGVLRRLPADPHHARQAPAAVRRPLPGQRDDHRADLRPRCARHRLGAGGARVSHDLHRRRRLLQQAEPAGKRPARPVCGEPLGPRAGRDRPAIRPRTRSRWPSTAGRDAGGRRVFLFLNVSAVHQPNCFYLAGRREDSHRSRTPPRWPTSTAACRRCSTRSVAAGRPCASSARTTAPPMARTATRASPGPSRRLDRALRRVRPAGEP